jgi:hypothetical protein
MSSRSAWPKIYVTNYPNNIGAVTTYTADGSQSAPTITAGLSNPLAVAVDATGKIHVTNCCNSTVTTYTADGSQSTPTITAGVSGPWGVAVDAAGKIYVANTGNNATTALRPTTRTAPQAPRRSRPD